MKLLIREFPLINHPYIMHVQGMHETMVYDDDDKDVYRFEVGHSANISLVVVYVFLTNVFEKCYSK